MICHKFLLKIVSSFLSIKHNVRDFIQVSPHKNIKKVINGNVLTENVLRANREIVNKT